MKWHVAEAMNRLVDFLRRSTLPSLFLLSALAGGLTGWSMAFMLSRSEYALMVEQLSHYQPSVLSRIYADDGATIIGEFYLQRRIPVEYSEIPLIVRQAFIAVEDARFYQHSGLDPIRVIGALLDNLQQGEIVGGGSTITQQLARGLFLTREQTLVRKIKEALLALLIEQHYSKEQILELYCNLIYLGGNAYGVEAAAQYYFGQSIKELNLEQSAMLAAMLKSAIIYSPLKNPEAALQRRNLVLNLMAEQGYITPEQAAIAKAQPIKLWRGERINNAHSPYAYVVEMIRQEVENKYGTQKTHGGGLQIYTTLDAQAQQWAVAAVRKQLHAFDRSRGWRGKLENILAQGKSLDTYYNPEWDNQFVKDQYYTGLVMQVSEREAIVRFGEYTARVTPAESPWGKPLKALIKPGDLTVFHVKAIDAKNKQLQVTLLQLPEVQGALVALDVPTGEIKALVGGYDFNRSKFNRATQALRQTGSAFKPFIYAAAIEYGLRPDDPVEDTPFQLGRWRPENYDRSYKGVISLQTALALSRNIPAVRLLKEVGIERGAQMVERLGLPNRMQPVLASALGSTEEPLLDMTRAYAIFASLGKDVRPHLIRRVVDRDGTELERWQPPSGSEVLSPYVASMVVTMLKEVVMRGTASAIGGYGFTGWDIGGKTGTVDDYTDAWFIGFTPTTCTGVWIGYDEKRTLGHGQTGGSAALPIWIDFMKDYLSKQKPKRFVLEKDPPPMMAELQSQRRHERAALFAQIDEGGLPGIGGPSNWEGFPSISLPVAGPIGQPDTPAETQPRRANRNP
ncbi:MAG: PBP1A family penicillin-binding protein [Acidobacteriota bacterium]|nr:PBP1A family penicillin-binding protein [Blastocatellia bacterium]MDW8238181.1 PBP1A family penicillin-binding protein [Acidobacteriota bacterium]